MKEIIKQGAEAILYKENGVLVKERVPKGYRLKEIDEELRLTRTRREVKCINEASRAGVNVPSIISHDNFTIKMEFVDGDRVKDVLNSNIDIISEDIGKTLAKLHSHKIVHGDPTTSNMIWKDDKLYVIDFGLSKITDNIESKAIDLYVLEEALKAAHYNVLERSWKIVIKSYKENYKDAEKVLNQLKKVKLRVRYADRVT